MVAQRLTKLEGVVVGGGGLVGLGVGAAVGVLRVQATAHLLVDVCLLGERLVLALDLHEFLAMVGVVDGLQGAGAGVEERTERIAEETGLGGSCSGLTESCVMPGGKEMTPVEEAAQAETKDGESNSGIAVEGREVHTPALTHSMSRTLARRTSRLESFTMRQSVVGSKETPASLMCVLTTRASGRLRCRMNPP